jgi:ferredoxin
MTDTTSASAQQGGAAPQRLRLRVDEHECVGSRLCQMAAPEVFRVDEARGVAVVLAEEVDGTEATWEAVESCPREAISASDAATGEQLFP